MMWPISWNNVNQKVSELSLLSFTNSIILFPTFFVAPLILDPEILGRITKITPTLQKASFISG